MATPQSDVAIIGAGPAGLANAAALAARGITALVFEAAPDAGQSWRHHYARLHLHTVRWLSGLPGLPIPRALGRWVAAQDYAGYLERYARHHRLGIATGTVVQALERADTGWRVVTDKGNWRAGKVIVATGLNRVPALPDWARGGTFAGTVLHSSDYRDASPFAGRDVLVVGAGNSGFEIALDLALGGAARVRLAVRSGPNLMPRTILGVPTQAVGLPLAWLPPALSDVVVAVLQRMLFGDVRRLDLPRPAHGLFTQIARDQVAPVLDVGFIATIAARRIEIVSAVTALAGGDATLADGSKISPEVVIAATGYRPGLGALLGAAVALDERGLPRLSRNGAALGAPGLFCAGYIVSAEGVLRAIGRQSLRIAAEISRR